MVAKTKGRCPLVSQAEGGEIRCSPKAKERDPLVSQVKRETCCSLKQTCHVCSLAVELLHNNGPCHRWKVSDCIPTTHNRYRRKIEMWNYIFICQFFVVCPSGAICDKKTLRICFVLSLKMTEDIDRFRTPLIWSERFSK